ncbi:MAG TPA: hypothetical protein VK985_04680 [Rariglobus sp.]|nr:hypothetical protein [Rariglobus sp.]
MDSGAKIGGSMGSEEALSEMGMTRGNCGSEVMDPIKKSGIKFEALIISDQEKIIFLFI